MRLAAALAVALAAAPPAGAREVALELVLAVDASTSVDHHEFDLQRDGIRFAFEHPAVIDAILALGPDGLAVSLVQWAGAGDQRTVVGWTLVAGEPDAIAFAAEVAAAPRLLSGLTDIGGAIRHSLRGIEENGFEGRRRVIDVSGDGTSDNRLVWADRDNAVERGVTINGLVVRGGGPTSHLQDIDIVEHFRRDVIGGEGAFLVTAADFGDFEDAILKKLLCELRGPDEPQEPDPAKRCTQVLVGEAPPAGPDRFPHSTGEPDGLAADPSEPAPPGGGLAHVHRLEPRPGAGPVQGRDRGQLSGAERKAGGPASRVAWADHGGAGLP